MKVLLRRLLRQFDLDLVRTHTTYEGHLRRLLRALAINLVLDVGAHDGEYASLLREQGYTGRIVSFEPVRDTYASLVARMGRDPGWRGYNVALGAARGRLPINVTDATDQTSFLTPTANATAWFGESSRVRRTETVAVERLDDLIESCLDGIAGPRVYLKLDTQGYDLQVIEGAAVSLQRWIVGMQSEIAAQALYEGMPLFPQNVQPYLDLGFEPTGLFAVSRDPRDMIAAIEYDLVLRRKT